MKLPEIFLRILGLTALLTMLLVAISLSYKLPAEDIQIGHTSTMEIFIAIVSKTRNWKLRDDIRTIVARWNNPDMHLQFHIITEKSFAHTVETENEKHHDMTLFDETTLGTVSEIASVLKSYNFVFFTRMDEGGVQCLEKLLIDYRLFRRYDLLLTSYQCPGKVRSGDDFLMVSQDVLELIYIAIEKKIIPKQNLISTLWRDLTWHRIPLKRSGNLMSFKPTQHMDDTLADSSMLLPLTTVSPVSLHPSESLLQVPQDSKLASACPSVGSKGDLDHRSLLLLAKCIREERKSLLASPSERLFVAQTYLFIARKIRGTAREVANELFGESAELFASSSVPHVALAITNVLQSPGTANTWSILAKTLSYLSMKEAFVAFETAFQLNRTDMMARFHQGAFLSNMNSYYSRVLSQCALDEAWKSNSLPEPYQSIAEDMIKQNSAEATEIMDNFAVLVEVDVASTSKAFVADMRTRIYNSILGNTSSKTAFLVNYSEQGNHQASLIQRGLISFCQHYNISFTIYQCDCPKCVIRNNRSLPDLILMYGGETFDRSCYLSVPQRIMQKFSKTSLLIFPQFVEPWLTVTDPNMQEKFRSHEQVVFIPRDHVSTRLLDHAFPSVTSQSAPDVTFWLGDEIEANHNESLHSPIIWIEGTDDRPPFSHHGVEFIQWHSDNGHFPHDNTSASQVRMLRHRKVVITNVLQAYIYATLVGKPSVLLDTGSWEMRTFYTSWGKANPSTFPSGSRADALHLAWLILQQLDAGSNILTLLPELVEAKSRWLTVPSGSNAFPSTGELVAAPLHAWMKQLAGNCSKTLQHSSSSALSPIPLPSPSSDNQVSHRLLTFAKKRERNGTLILTFVTKEYADLALNWAQSLDEVGCSFYMIIALDAFTHENLKVNNRSCFPLDVEGKGDDDSSFFSASRKFLQVMRLRSWVVAVLVRAFNILLSDVDVAIQTNPFDVILSLPQYDIYLTSDSRHPNPTLPQYNGGFFYMRNSCVCKQLALMIYTKLLQDENMDDQRALNILVTKMTKEKLLNATLLNADRFQNGFYYYERKAADNQSALPPVVVHFNWIYSAANKRLRMRESGLLRIPAPGTCFNSQRRYLLPLLGAADNYITVRNSLIEAATIALQSNRTLILPKMPRYIKPSKEAAQAGRQMQQDTVERYFDIGLLETAIGSDGYCESRVTQHISFQAASTFCLSPQQRNASGDSSFGCGHAKTSEELAHAVLEGNVTVVVLNGRFPEIAKDSAHYRHVDLHIWHTRLFEGLVSGTTKKWARRQRLCIRTENSTQSTPILSAIRSAVLLLNCSGNNSNTPDLLGKMTVACGLQVFLAAPPQQRALLRRQGFERFLLTNGLIPDADQLQVPFDIENCIQATHFMSDNCSSPFAMLVCSRRQREEPCCKPLRSVA